MIYRLKDGTRVTVARSKQFPIGNCRSDCEREMRERMNEQVGIFRVKDGHEIWGCTTTDLLTEEEWLATRKKS